MADALRHTAPPDTYDRERVFFSDDRDENKAAERFEQAALQVIDSLDRGQFPELYNKPLKRRYPDARLTLDVLQSDQDFPMRGGCDRCDACVEDPARNHPHD